MSGLWNKLGYYRRMVHGLNELLGTPPYADPERVIREQLEHREQRFLDTVRQAIFSRPEHPYTMMFRNAGCTYEDLESAVGRDGLEAALASLHRNGIYLSHDEFKGMRPIVRSNREIPSTPDSFRNSFVRGGVVGSSGGSRSSGTKVVKSIPSRLHTECYKAMEAREFDLKTRDRVLVRPILPASDGIIGQVTSWRVGCPSAHWFSMASASLDSVHYSAATNLLVTFAKMRGARMCYPEALPPDDFSPVARWVAERKRQGVLCTVSTFPSPASRIAAAALEGDWDIAGTLFLVGGETLTPARREGIERAGAHVHPFYPISEIGPIGMSCRQMTTGNCVHQFHDSVAVISYRRRAPLSDVEVDSLLFTTLSPHAPFHFINVEMDDCGVIEPVKCDCTFARLGFHRQIRDIASYGKLTGQGVTLVGSDALRVLEHALPERFGGCASDYQLVELDGDRQARLVLRVSRRLAISSTADVKMYFLGQLRQFQGGAGASRIWRDTGTLEVIHDDPIVTPRGKVLPLQLLRTSREKHPGS